MVKGLVLYDYDGTLVDERDEIYVPTQLTKAAISRLQDLGYLCVLATGRALSYIPNGAKDLHLDGYVTSNGAYVTVHGKVIHNDVFSEEELLSLLQYMDSLSINYILEGTKFCYVKDLKESEYLHFMDNFKIPEDNFVKYRGFEDVRGRIGKITLTFPNRKQLETSGAELEKTYLCSYHRNCNTFDIAKKTIHKGVGARAIIDYFHIPMDATIAFGDGDNDVELLAGVVHGVAMRKHDPKLDAVASMVTGTVKEEGIYKALKKLEVI